MEKIARLTLIRFGTRIHRWANGTSSGAAPGKMPLLELQPRPRAEARPPQHLVTGRGRAASPLSANPSGAGGGDGFWPS